MAAELRIAVYYDLICPWCLIGKRHLATAIGQLAALQPAVVVHVAWHPVQLLPDLPLEGLPFTAFYVQRLGSPQAVMARQAQVNAAAAAAGLHIDFSRIARMPNTGLALRLLDHASTVGNAQRHEALIDQLFGAHFLHGRDIGDVATLVALAQDSGFDGPAVHAVLTHAAPAAPVPPPLQPRAGVPYFVFNDQYALAGAQPPKILLEALRQAVS